MFVPGQIYRRRALHEMYGGQQQGGISTPAKHRFVFLFTGQSGEPYGYKDGWQDNGVFYYTGEGQMGDMRLVAGNRAIHQHVEDRKDLHLFEQAQRAHVRYIGQFVCSGLHYQVTHTREGKQRQAIVFELMPIEEFSGRADSANWGESFSAEALQMTLAQLRELAIRDSGESREATERRVFDALRSATAINCPDWVRERTSAALEGLDIPDAVAVVDAICTADHELPLLSTEFSEPRWEGAITDVMVKGRSSLERLIEGSGNQARFTLEKAKACLAVSVATGGFHRFMLTFADRPDFLEVMADHIIRDEEVKRLSSQLASVLNAIHMSRPEIFRQRALAAIDAGASEVIHAASNNLRVFSGATEEDIAVIQAYAGYADPVAKLGAIFAITYMGKFTDLLPALKEAVLSVHTEGNNRVAAELADAFGPYGVPLTSLTRDEAAGLVKEFALIHDWDYDQGAIPRFLNHFVSLFPDEMLDVLIDRIERNSAARAASLPGLRTFGLLHGDVSFSNVPTEKRMELAAKVLRRALMPGTREEASDLFWDVAGIDDRAFDLILRDAPGISEDSVTQLVALLDKAPLRLVFNKLQFVKDVLRSFHGAARQRVIDIIAYQSYRRGGGVFTGDPQEMMAKEQRSFRDAVDAFPEDPELDELLLAMRRFL